jgi:hypothetical protein
MMHARAHRSPLVFRMVRGASWTIAWLLALSSAAWAFGALYFDFPILNIAAAGVFALAAVATIVFVRGPRRKLGATFLAFALVLAWWLTLKPSNTRAWQPDVGQAAWAEVKGDEVTLHNVRNCYYRTDTDYTPHWETRTVRLSQLTGLHRADILRHDRALPFRQSSASSAPSPLWSRFGPATFMQDRLLSSSPVPCSNA